VIAQFECGIACFERHTAELTGTRGMIIVESPWLPGDGAATVRAITGDGQTKLLQATPADEYLLEVREFVEVCTGKAVPRWPVSDAVANMKVIDALYRSAREGAAVNL
jgi:predicted dehydrogenase